MKNKSTPAPKPASVDGFTFIQEAGGISEYLLNANGLKVLVHPIAGSPTATFMVTYLVGARNEVTGTIGATHFLEHMMFKDTEQHRTSRGNRLDQFIEQVGGLSNATTWLDRTNYFATVVKEQLEGYLAIEAGRMRHLLLKDEEVRSESTVILDELERGESRPAARLHQEIYAAAFTAHPYHHPTIGWRSDVEKMTAEKLRAFYDTFYWPDNATASVIGGIAIPEALALVKKYFGGYPKAPRPVPPMITEEPPQLGPRRVLVRRTGQVALVSVAHKIPPAGHVDHAALSILQEVLADGTNSRLHRALVDRNLATRVSGSIDAFRDPGLGAVTATLMPGAAPAEVEAIILSELERIKSDGVTDVEVRTAIAKTTAQEAYARDGSLRIARRLNECIAAGDWKLFLRAPEAIRKVTPADVRRVARTYWLEDQSTTGWFVPTAPKGSNS